MSEVMIYRTKKMDRHLCLVISVVLLVVGALSISNSIASYSGVGLWMTQFVSWAFTLMGWWFAMGVQAMDNGGLCRRIFQRLGGDFTYPPLSDWRDDLEDQGAFEVSYEPE